VKYVYLCGPVTGRPKEEAFNQFCKAEQKIARMAKDGKLQIYVSNPMRFCTPDLDWPHAMRLCIGALCRSEGVALLKGWQRSRGANLELSLAAKLRIPLVFIEPADDEHGGLQQIFAAAPEAGLYYNALLEQWLTESPDMDYGLAADRAAAELFNRYLDPHGFEYISVEEEKEHGTVKTAGR
jgi:hypothetical protein